MINAVVVYLSKIVTVSHERTTQQHGHVLALLIHHSKCTLKSFAIASLVEDTSQQCV